MDRSELVIGGRKQPAAEGTTFTVSEPGRGTLMAEVAQAGAEDVRRAVAAAHRAFESGPWSRTSATERGRVLSKVAALVRERLEDIAVVEARNGGKPIGDARGEVGGAAASFEYFGGAANKIFGESIPVQDLGLDVTLREPVGVCALIVPWNFPLLIAAWKIAPALACGNTVVVKPASYTPLSVLMLADILVEAGVPDEAVSVLPGPGGTVGGALVADPRVSKISFTGSTEVGAGIMAQAAANIARVSLELGGKSANVVFADADLERCVPASVASVFGNCGQDCCARSRVIVERPIYEEFVEAFAKRTAEVRTAYREALDDDLNLPQGVGLVFDHIREANAALDAGRVGPSNKASLLELIDDLDAHLDVIRVEEPGLAEEVERLIAEREEARRARDFDRADRIRDDLRSRGIALEDSRDGVRWRRISPGPVIEAGRS